MCIDLKRYIETKKISNNKTKPNETKRNNQAWQSNETKRI